MELIGSAIGGYRYAEYEGASGVVLVDPDVAVSFVQSAETFRNFQ